MVGGTKEAVAVVEPAFLTLAPEGGYAHVGPVGAGHFVKMVHNGIEYGLMQAYAEGFEVMGAAKEFDLDLHEIASIWRYGSVVRSWLLDLAERALRPGAGFEEIKGVVADSGEGRWTAQEAIDRGVSAPVIATSLFTRFASQNEDSLQLKMLSALRNQFGGHAVTLESGQQGMETETPDPLAACSPRSTTSRAPSATRCARPSRRAPGPRFALVLSGGPTAQECYEVLATADGIDWSLVDVYVGDERVVPPDDDDANQRLIKEALLDRVGPVGSFSPMPTVGPVDECVAAYQRTMSRPGDRSRDRPGASRHGPRRPHRLAVPGRPHASTPARACWSWRPRTPTGATRTRASPSRCRPSTRPASRSSRWPARPRPTRWPRWSAARISRPPASTPDGRCGWWTAPRCADAP